MLKPKYWLNNLVVLRDKLKGVGGVIIATDNIENV